MLCFSVFLSRLEASEGRGGALYNGLFEEALPERGTAFSGWRNIKG